MHGVKNMDLYSTPTKMEKPLQGLTSETNGRKYTSMSKGFDVLFEGTTFAIIKIEA